MLFESQLRDLRAMLPWVATNRAKRALRTIDSQKRRILTESEVKEASQKVIERIAAMQHFIEAKTVMIYYPVHNEIDLRGLVQQYASEKKFLFPGLTHKKHKMQARLYEPHTPFVKGRFGVPEPKTEAYTGKIDMMIVPGMSFDKRHWRVGRGGGYYDRFIGHYPTVYKVGVGYDFQLHNQVPHWWGDKRMNRIVTPTQTI